MHEAFGLSGEEISPQVQRAFGTKPLEQANASKIATTNVLKREYQKEYMEYWNSTTELTGTGRPVDAFIAALAPYPAARPELYTYYGYSTIVNLLDYTACVVPVTTADKNIDLLEKDFKPLSDEDKKVADACGFFYYGSSVSYS